MKTVASTRRPIRLFWWSPKREARLGFKEMRRNGQAWLRMNGPGTELLSNFGDELSPRVLEYATGRRVVWAPPKRADVVAVGSIIEYYARRSTSEAVIWGAGLRDLPSPELISQIKSSAGRFAAVRGPQTAKALGLPLSMPLGDPGTIVPEIGTFRGARSGVLFLPHFRTWTTQAGRSEMQRAQELGMRVVPPSTRPLDMVDIISRSDMVLSSSLHGVVVAHSLGVPVQSLGIPSGGMNEPEFKYDDYFGSIGLTFNRIPVSACFDPKVLARVTAQREADVEAASKGTRQLAHNLVAAASSI